MSGTDLPRPSQLRALAWFVLLTACLVAGGYSYFQHEEQALRKDGYKDLHAIAQLKIGQVQAWRQERLDDARVTAASPLFRRAVTAWLAGDRHGQLQADLQQRLVMEQQERRYTDVLLVDPQARILLSATSEPDSIGPATVQTVQAAISGSRSVLSNLYRCPHGRVHVDAAAAVIDDQGRPLAAVVLRSNARDFLYPLIASWPTSSRTAETLLVRREGSEVLFLNDLRFRPETALSLRLPLSRLDIPAVQAVLGRQGAFDGLDYRGVPVLADLDSIPGSPWYLVAKVDQAEILAEVHYRAVAVAGLVLLAVLLAGAGIAYTYRWRQTELYRRLYQTTQERYQTEEEFRATLYSIGDAVITTDTEGRVQRLNPVAEALTGWPEAEARGKPLPEVFRIVNEQTRAVVDSPVTLVLRQGIIVGLANHTILLARDGTERPVADSGAPIRDERGRTAGVVLTFRDQTEERHATAELTRQKDLLAAVVNHLPDYIYAKDQGSRFLLANRVLADDLGCTDADTLLGHTDQEFFPLEMAAGFLADEQEVLRTGQPLLNLEEMIQTAAGRTKTILTSKVPLLDRDGAITGLVGIGHDITPLRQEEQLRHALHRLRDQVLQMQGEADWVPVTTSVQTELRPLVQFATCSISLVDPADGVTLFYRSFADGTVDTRRYPCLFAAIERARATGQPVLRRTRSEMAELQDGIEETTIQSVVDVPFGPGTLAVNSTSEDAFGEEDLGILGQFAQVLAEAHRRVEDLKALAESEARFRQAQKLEAVGQLAGGVAHDFNNILTIIHGGCHLLLRQLPTDDPRRQEVEQVAQAGERGANLVRQLLAFSRRQSWHPEVVNLNLMVTELSRMLGRVIGENIQLELRLDPGLALVRVDRGQMEQVLTNLVLNARDAMPAGGHLILATSNVESAPASKPSSLPPAASGVCLSVTDTGLGMDAQTQAHLFEPFFTTKEPDKGTGLGLATVYGIVQQANGSIEVTSAPGQGSTFTVFLPREDGATEALSGPQEVGQYTRGSETILVVEDDPGVRRLVVQVLKAEGYTVLAAASGAEALEILTQRQGAIHLMITDVVMPVMAGTELASQVRGRYPQVRLLYMSGYAEHAGLPSTTGMAPLLQKPFTPDVLARQVRELLDRGHGPPL